VTTKVWQDEYLAGSEASGGLLHIGSDRPITHRDVGQQQITEAVKREVDWRMLSPAVAVLDSALPVSHQDNRRTAIQKIAQCRQGVSGPPVIRLSFRPTDGDIDPDQYPLSGDISFADRTVTLHKASAGPGGDGTTPHPPLLQLALQRPNRDPQRACSASAITITRPKSLQDGQLLQVTQCPVDRQRRFTLCRTSGGMNRGRQIGFRQDLLAAQHHHTLETITQLPDVARPIVLRQEPLQVGIQP
jgi:hypothetical protein